MRFMAIASVVCASRLIEPKLIAPVAKRLTISLAGSTSSSGERLVGRFRNSISPRMVSSRSFCSLIVSREGRVVVAASCRAPRAAGCATVSGVQA